MTFIAATEDQVLTVTAAPDTVYAFFAQPQNLCEALGSVESCEIRPDGRVHWVLTEKVDQGIRFQGDYVVTWTGDGAGHVGWRFVEGNMRNEGDVWLRPLPEGGTEIRYREVVEPDLPVTPLMARLIRPLVVRELRREIGRFLDHVRVQFSN